MTDTDFRLMVIRHQYCLQPYAITLTRDVVNAQDLCQETMLRAFLNWEKFCFGTNLKAWLTTIMHNIFINTYRKQRRYPTGDISIIADVPPKTLVTQNGAFSHMQLMEIRKAISELPTPNRLPFELYYTGYKYKEIANLMDEPLGTIKSRIYFARKALTEMLER